VRLPEVDPVYKLAPLVRAHHTDPQYSPPKDDPTTQTGAIHTSGAVPGTIPERFSCPGCGYPKSAYETI